MSIQKTKLLIATGSVCFVLLSLVKTITCVYSTCDLDLLFRGVLQCAQKVATQFGDCVALISFWKNSLNDYHDAKKVIKLFVIR